MAIPSYQQDERQMIFMLAFMAVAGAIILFGHKKMRARQILVPEPVDIPPVAPEPREPGVPM